MFDEQKLATAHKDGWRLTTREHHGDHFFVIRFFANGVEVDRIRSTMSAPAEESNRQREAFLIVAMLRYLNMGGSCYSLSSTAENLGSRLFDLDFNGLELFQILKSSPPNVVWKTPQGGYARIVEGHFSELLDEKEMAEFLDAE